MNEFLKIHISLVIFICALLILTSCKKKTDLPQVKTAEITNITQTQASAGGNVISEGASSVSSKGVCWSTSENPNIINSKTLDGTGTGSFTSKLTQLTPGSKYYVRAYATNELGTGYGSQVSFVTTRVSLAVLTTNAVTSITDKTAISGGDITIDGGGLITARGVCWGTDPNPTTDINLTNDGTGSGSFSSIMTKLDNSTTYHVRAYATNSSGTAYGNDLMFATTGGKPVAVTYPASNVTSVSATLEGSVSANALSTTVVFEFGTTTAYGSFITATPSPITNDNVTVSTGLSGLDPATTYHFRVKAFNASGTTYAGDQSFKTLGGEPSVSTSDPTAITSTSATLNGYVIANYSSTSVTFEYGTTINYGQSVAASPGIVLTENNVSANISNLNAATTYHYRAKAVNSLGTVYSSDQTFTTLGGPPSASTYPASGRTSTTVTLEGNVSANYLSTAVTFDYGTTTDYGQSVAAVPSPVNDNNVNVLANLTGLLVGTTYHFRIKAVNASGTAYGSDQNFTTLGGLPSASTNEATVVGSISAILNGYVIANYSLTTVSFEYGTTLDFGQTIPASPGTVMTESYVSVNVTDLNIGTLYYFRVKAINAFGTTYGGNQTLTTLGGPPMASTYPVSDRMPTGATLNGNVSANYSSTTVTFEFGTSLSYGQTFPAVPGTVTGDYVNVSAIITDLVSGTTYHYRVKAVNALGTTYGNDQTFTL